MITFYKDELGKIEEKSNIEISSYKEQKEILREEIKDINNSTLEKEKSYKAEIRELQEKSKLEVLDLKETHKNSMTDKIEQLNSKYELELDKKALEVEKLKNEIDQLKSKPTKKDPKSKSSSEEIIK